MTRRTLAYVLLLPLFIAAGCDRGDHPRQLGKPAPDFTLNDGDRTLQLSSFRGKVVVLNFWATWCAPCVQEIPSLNQLQQQLPQVVVVGVSVDKDADAYRRFLVRHQVGFATIRDDQRRINTLYGTSLFPETYIIDRSGQIRRKFINAQDWTSPEIVDYLARL